MGQRVVVEILAGPNVGESMDFTHDSIMVGRGSQCQLQLASPHVSRQQCELSWQGDQLVLENLGSVNLTYLNDRPVDRVYVQDGDLVTFCDVALRVRIPRPQQALAADPDRTVAFGPGAQPPGVRPGQPVGPAAGGPTSSRPGGAPAGAGPPPGVAAARAPAQPPRGVRPPAAAPPQAPAPLPPRMPPPVAAVPPRPPQPPGPPPGSAITAPPRPGPGPAPMPPPQALPQPLPQRPTPAPPMAAGPPPNVYGTGQFPGYPPQPGAAVAGTGLHGALPPQPQAPPGAWGAPAPGYGAPPGMPGYGGPAPGMPGMPPGPMPGMPPGPGIPGMPPGHGVAPNAATGVQGVLSARRKKKGGPSNKGGKPNIQLIRNVIVGVAAVMLLLMLTSVVSKKSTPKKKPGGAAGAAAAGEATPAPAVPKALRGNRTDDEILREAERLYGTGSTYLREYQIADESLWTAVDFFHKAQAEMALVDPSKWPGFAREIDPKIAEAQGLLEQEFKDSKINYVREKQSGRYAEAIAEMERVMRMFPDRNDARHKFARDQIKIVRHLMEGGKSKFGFGGGDDG